jgi:hypothetical protein
MPSVRIQEAIRQKAAKLAVDLAAAKVREDIVAAHAASKALLMLVQSPSAATETTVPDTPEFQAILATCQRSSDKMQAMLENNTSPVMKLLTIGLTDLAILLFGVRSIARWKYNKHEVRSIWEHLEPVEQCTSGVGQEAGHKCWICGFEIPDVLYGDAKKPECEHILPIAQGVTFLTLYAYENVEKIDQRVYQLEYDWAHSHCNQVKNDDVYFKNNLDRSGLPQPDESKFRNLLDRILTSDRTGSESFVKELNIKVNLLKKDNWLRERTAVFRQKYDAIVSFMRQPHTSAPNLFVLGLLSSALDIANRITDPKKRELLGLAPPSDGSPPLKRQKTIGGRKTRRRPSRRRKTRRLPLH